MPWDDDRAYLLARAIQFFLPGVPQVYYVGLLAGHNDMSLLARSGVGRDINRHYYAPAEIQANLQRPVVKALLELIRLRNSHPAFGGRFSLEEGTDPQLRLRWSLGAHCAQLDANLASGVWQIDIAGDAQGDYALPELSALLRG
jgi:sucrose phosphorylase